MLDLISSCEATFLYFGGSVFLFSILVWFLPNCFKLGVMTMVVADIALAAGIAFPRKMTEFLLEQGFPTTAFPSADQAMIFGVGAGIVFFALCFALYYGLYLRKLKQKLSHPTANYDKNSPQAKYQSPRSDNKSPAQQNKASFKASKGNAPLPLGQQESDGSLQDASNQGGINIVVGDEDEVTPAKKFLKQKTRSKRARARSLHLNDESNLTNLEGNPLYAGVKDDSEQEMRLSPNAPVAAKEIKNPLDGVVADLELSHGSAVLTNEALSQVILDKPESSTLNTFALTQSAHEPAASAQTSATSAQDNAAQDVAAQTQVAPAQATDNTGANFAQDTQTQHLVQNAYASHDAHADGALAGSTAQAALEALNAAEKQEKFGAKDSAEKPVDAQAAHIKAQAQQLSKALEYTAQDEHDDAETQNALVNAQVANTPYDTHGDSIDVEMLTGSKVGDVLSAMNDGNLPLNSVMPRMDLAADEASSLSFADMLDSAKKYQNHASGDDTGILVDVTDDIAHNQELSYQNLGLHTLDSESQSQDVAQADQAAAQTDQAAQSAAQADQVAALSAQADQAAQNAHVAHGAADQEHGDAEGHDTLEHEYDEGLTEEPILVKRNQHLTVDEALSNLNQAEFNQAKSPESPDHALNAQDQAEEQHDTQAKVAPIVTLAPDFDDPTASHADEEFDMDVAPSVEITTEDSDLDWPYEQEQYEEATSLAKAVKAAPHAQDDYAHDDYAQTEYAQAGRATDFETGIEPEFETGLEGEHAHYQDDAAPESYTGSNTSLNVGSNAGSNASSDEYVQNLAHAMPELLESTKIVEPETLALPQDVLDAPLKASEQSAEAKAKAFDQNTQYEQNAHNIAALDDLVGSVKDGMSFGFTASQNHPDTFKVNATQSSYVTRYSAELNEANLSGLFTEHGLGNTIAQELNDQYLDQPIKAASAHVSEPTPVQAPAQAPAQTPVQKPVQTSIQEPTHASSPALEPSLSEPTETKLETEDKAQAVPVVEPLATASSKLLESALKFNPGEASATLSADNMDLAADIIPTIPVAPLPESVLNTTFKPLEHNLADDITPSIPVAPLSPDFESLVLPNNSARATPIVEPKLEPADTAKAQPQVQPESLSALVSQPAANAAITAITANTDLKPADTANTELKPEPLTPIVEPKLEPADTAKAQPQSNPESLTAMGSQPAANTAITANTDLKPADAANTEFKPESKVETKPKAQAKPEIESKVESQGKVESQPKARGADKTEAQAASAESAPMLQAKSKQDDTQADTPAEPQPQAQAKPKTQADKGTAAPVATTTKVEGVVPLADKAVPESIPAAKVGLQKAEPQKAETNKADAQKPESQETKQPAVAPMGLKSAPSDKAKVVPTPAPVATKPHSEIADPIIPGATPKVVEESRTHLAAKHSPLRRPRPMGNVAAQGAHPAQAQTQAQTTQVKPQSQAAQAKPQAQAQTSQSQAPVAAPEQSATKQVQTTNTTTTAKPVQSAAKTATNQNVAKPVQAAHTALGTHGVQGTSATHTSQPSVQPAVQQHTQGTAHPALNQAQTVQNHAHPGQIVHTAQSAKTAQPTAQGSTQALAHTAGQAQGLAQAKVASAPVKATQNPAQVSAQAAMEPEKKAGRPSLKSHFAQILGKNPPGGLAARNVSAILNASRTPNVGGFIPKSVPGQNPALAESEDRLAVAEKQHSLKRISRLSEEEQAQRSSSRLGSKIENAPARLRQTGQEQRAALTSSQAQPQVQPQSQPQVSAQAKTSAQSEPQTLAQGPAHAQAQAKVAPATVKSQSQVNTQAQAQSQAPAKAPIQAQTKPQVPDQAKGSAQVKPQAKDIAPAPAKLQANEETKPTQVTEAIQDNSAPRASLAKGKARNQVKAAAKPALSASARTSSADTQAKSAAQAKSQAQAKPQSQANQSQTQAQSKAQAQAQAKTQEQKPEQALAPKTQAASKEASKTSAKQVKPENVEDMPTNKAAPRKTMAKPNSLVGKSAKSALSARNRGNAASAQTSAKSHEPSHVSQGASEQQDNEGVTSLEHP